MKLTDKLADILKYNKVSHAFGLQGGAVVHIFDSLEKKKINVTYTHHEQTASLAAVANSKITDVPGCVVITTGPATTNAMTGLLSAWQDSVPVIFISGQARSSHMSYNKKVRQVGTQEVNICDIVKPITKYASVIRNVEKFPEEFQKAINISVSGRKGPVWIDLPIDLQWSRITRIKSVNKKPYKLKFKSNSTSKELEKFASLFKKSKKPLAIIGYGLRSSFKGINLFKKFVTKTNLPFVSTWNAADIFPTDHKLNNGIIGMSGQRGANKKVFDSDLLICLGTHLSIPHTTTLYNSYAPNSKKIIVNIDKDQLKNLNVRFDLKIQDDLNNFLKKINKMKFVRKKDYNIINFKNLNWYHPSEFKNHINSNLIVRDVSKKLKNKCLIVDGGGTALYSGFQSSKLFKGDRIICSSAISSMGTGLAETIGVCKTNKFKTHICVIGDGSFLMNIRDLQTISEMNKKIIILLINNNGYLAIRHTQKEYLSSKFYGTHPDWNLKMPNFEKVIKSFGISYVRVKKQLDYQKIRNRILNYNKPIVCEVVTSEDQESLFKQGSKDNGDGTHTPMPLSEMYPFISKPISNTNN